ncbi:DUF932 domain-containing protein [Peristeroidobacter soli]|uniref:DUF932 domain-containing protein n=1 Tax=Peristeroidobacter soli TaxID=2497877 RepID=UPI00101B99F5|nr:DUF932 domain-containing protein [Peristeroidobacter soli]
MKTIQTLLGDIDCDSAFVGGLDRMQLEKLTPAVYAQAPHEKLSAKYAFLPTSVVIATMGEAGFNVVQAAQSRSRRDLPAFARHALRFRRAKSEVYVGEVVPEILILNSHDGSSAYLMFGCICHRTWGKCLKSSICNAGTQRNKKGDSYGARGVSRRFSIR